MDFKTKNIIILILFVFLQIIWLNHLKIFGLLTPIVFLYPFLIMPPNKHENLQLILAFFVGLSLDIISHTGGVFTAVTVFITYTKKIYFWYLSKPGREFSNGILELGFLNKIIYYSIYIFIGILLIAILQSFHFQFVISRLYLIFFNTLITVFFIIFFEYLFIIKSKT